MSDCDLLDTVTDVVAIIVLGVIALRTGADPTTVIVTIAGLAGYRMQSRK